MSKHRSSTAGRKQVRRLKASDARMPSSSWGSGGEANRIEKSAGDTTCLACLPPLLTFRIRFILHHIGIHTQHIRSFKLAQPDNHNSSRKPASHVRFNNKEYSRIEKDSINKGKSIPTLLREKYFSSPWPLPLVTKIDVERIFDDYRRIGHVMNEAARRVNSGMSAGLIEDLEEVLQTFEQLWMFLTTKYCRCEPLPQK